MIAAICILLWLAAVWAVAGHCAAMHEGRRLRQSGNRSPTQTSTMCGTLIAAILALGFLGVLLK